MDIISLPLGRDKNKKTGWVRQPVLKRALRGYLHTKSEHPLMLLELHEIIMIVIRGIIKNR
jgi:hypothetical protein